MSDSDGALQPPPGAIPNFQHPKDIASSLNAVTHILCMCIVTPLTVLRIYTKARIQRCMNREDWVCIAAFTMFLVYCINTMLMSYVGGGYHQWEISKGQLKNFYKAVYRGSLIYGPTAFLIKVTLLLISTRVFAPLKRTVISINIFIGAMVCYYLPVLFIKILICRPIAGFWDPDVQSTCLDEHALFIADTVISVTTDLAVLTIPMPLIWMLHMSLKRKLKVVALLSAGGVATCFSIVRLFLIFRIGNDPDTSVRIIQFGLLGSAEVTIGLICASLPAVNNLLTCCADRVAKSKNSNQDVGLSNSMLGHKSPSKPSQSNSVEWWTYNEVRSDSNVNEASMHGRDGVDFSGEQTC